MPNLTDSQFIMILHPFQRLADETGSLRNL